MAAYVSSIELISNAGGGLGGGGGFVPPPLFFLQELLVNIHTLHKQASMNRVFLTIHSRYRYCSKNPRLNDSVGQE